MWQILRVYEAEGKLLKAMKSFYVDSRACVRVGNDVSEWFPVNDGLKQGCMTSPWLFNVYIDGMYIKQPWRHHTTLFLSNINGKPHAHIISHADKRPTIYKTLLCFQQFSSKVRVFRKGLELLSANGSRFEINQLLFADDTALVAGSEEKLCRLVSEISRICDEES